MRKDTKKYEQLLAGTKANLKMVREELLAGAPLDHVYNELQSHEQTFSARITEIKEWNKREEKRDAAAKQADRAKKLEELKSKLLRADREDLIKMAIGNKEEIEIKADTTIEAIVEAILKAAPENL